MNLWTLILYEDGRHFPLAPHLYKQMDAKSPKASWFLSKELWMVQSA